MYRPSREPSEMISVIRGKFPIEYVSSVSGLSQKKFRSASGRHFLETVVSVPSAFHALPPAVGY
jgi:hypothetical protein